MPTCTLLEGDALAVLPSLPDASIDAIVTDPPYEIGFMGQPWDRTGIAYLVDLWAEALRVLKPGGHLLAFGGSRTAHRMTCAIEDAGFEVRDTLFWLHGSGYPKSHYALKPAYEPITLARRPIRGSVAANIEQHGTGALDIDGCRGPGGRWPANLVLDEQAAADLGAPARYFYIAKASAAERDAGLEALPVRHRAGALKWSCDAYAERTGRLVSRRNHHPTVKPITLMRWLVRLVTPAGGVILDPFAGSGTTGVAALLEGRSFIGIERESDYAEIARARCANAAMNAAP